MFKDQHPWPKQKSYKKKKTIKFSNNELTKIIENNIYPQTKIKINYTIYENVLKWHLVVPLQFFVNL